MKRLLTPRLLTLLAFVAAALSLWAYKPGEVPNVHVVDRTRFLSDPDNILSSRAVALADSIMADIWKSTSAEVVAVVVDSVDSGTDPDTFATDLFELWGIGKKDNDNGLLVLVSVKDRAAVIRTGYGIEGVVPDVVAGSIIRNQMFPRFRQGDYDGGVLAGLEELRRVIVNPEYADELKSRYENDADASTDDSFWLLYVICGAAVCVGSLVYILYCSLAFSGDINRQWGKLNAVKITLLMLTVFFIGVPLPGYLVLVWRMKALRHKAPRCQRCSAKMEKLSQPDDHRWLDSGQLAERRVRSVEHDVWECPECGYGSVCSFDNARSAYTRCGKCGAKTRHLVSTRTLVPPTTMKRGLGESVYRCEHCGDEEHRPFEIAAKTPPVVIIPGGRGGGGFRGGGFSGGSFGGGHTGGGGASGRW